MASGKSSRAKGVAGERESADVFRRYGFEVVRLQNNVLDAGDYTAAPFWWSDEPQAPSALLVDAKRRERIDLRAACRQIEAVAANGQLPVVVWRSNREPWRISGRLEDFARLLGNDA